jgi:hypothetical protein
MFKKIFIIAVMSVQVQASVIYGTDQNGNECSIKTMDDEFIVHEKPERELGQRSAGDYLSTTERITTVDFSYYKKSFFGNKKVTIKGFKVHAVSDNFYKNGYSYVKSEGQSQSIYNDHLPLEEELVLEIGFDKNYKFGDMTYFKFDRWGDGKLFVYCNL